MDVQGVIDRLYRTVLEPPTYQPIRCWLVNTLDDDTDISMQISNFSVAEDQQMLRNGILVEVGQELMAIKEVDSPTVQAPTLTVERAMYGTTKETHLPGAEVRLSPMYSKQSVFEAVRDNIVTLHPSVFTVDVVHVSQVSNLIYPCRDDLAISIESAWPFEAQFGNMNVTVEILDYHPSIGGRAFRGSAFNGDLWIRYRKRMGVATSATDTLTDLGVEDTWTNIVLVGAAADLIAGRDLPHTFTDWASRIIEPTVIDVGKRQGIAARLRGYRDYLLEKASAEMTAEYAPVIVRRDPFSSVGRV